jgi:hypothetical protein
VTSTQECCDLHLIGLCLVFERPVTCIPEQIYRKNCQSQFRVFFISIWGLLHVSVQHDHLQAVYNIGHMYYPKMFPLDQNNL